ncbi:cobyric acid synthase [Desulforhopalus singaporensis]|uniref:Cobyric acid synthase n=1 Tax=Desulforhopalus singaporensis TaxID=91360 RepID=A0A1H0PI15_9BACT|nr:cobyric acid synthase [Desulforhopalus singaporensis]SDP04633.1 L-threonine O-3-phosphate decarboxylase /adenosylcobyric acid synthase (glutamine-hydrolysing) [Desulforhopalus singaporensis]
MKTFEHGGNIHKALRETGSEHFQIIDFSANINPLGPPEWTRSLLSSEIENLIHYPDPENTEFLQAVSEYNGVEKEMVVTGNGTTEILYTFMRVVDCSRVVIPVPSYVDYVRAAEIGGKNVETFFMGEQDDFDLDLNRLSQELKAGDLAVIATPNNPTGRMVKREDLLFLAEQHPKTLFLIDEAFIDFIDPALSLAGTRDNIVTLNSMTKFFGVPGLRVGYATMTPSLAGSIRENLPPWSVNTFAERFAVKALEDQQYHQESRSYCQKLREQLTAALGRIDGICIYPGTANYLFGRLDRGTSGELADFCRKRGILIRRCDNYRGLEQSQLFFRVAVRTEKENGQLVDTFTDYFHPSKKARKRDKKPAIMFQGTCSDAGKSILTAAMCRILLQDGLKVAPFKAQNMSLNSFVTLNGDEMGRAQVVQAQAARLDPDCRMNPILLKPNSDTGSQVILNGKPVGNMSVNQYNLYKPTIWDAVCRSYDSLAGEHDVMVLEGAGSPGEVNLKRDDIVNMKMADYAESPVILVGDIDRGGVYASFVGIMEVLAEWERNLVAGFLVNKFRGQASLLDSAHGYVFGHTKKPVMGVIPHLKNLGLPEEDSVSFKKGIFNTIRENDAVELVVINLPHISNFTDVEPFLDEPDVTLRVVDKKEDVGNPDAIILPGTKNVINDLSFLQSSGLVDVLRRCQSSGTKLVGICGGYQMLGNSIADPYQIESGLGQISGLGLINMETVIEKEKNLVRKAGVHNESGKIVFGYEIHHGISSKNRVPLLSFDDGSSCGSGTEDGGVWGSYLHGVFDSDEFRRWFIDELRTRKNLAPLGKIVAPYNLEAAFERLADTVRANIDMNAVYRLLKL